MADYNIWSTVSTSERTINNYLLNDVVGKTVANNGGTPCIVKYVNTYTDPRDLQDYIHYECVNDKDEYVGRFVIALGHMSLNGIRAITNISWFPREHDDSDKFDTKAVSDFLEGIEVV